MHVGMDVILGLIHSLKATAANTHGLTPCDECSTAKSIVSLGLRLYGHSEAGRTPKTFGRLVHQLPPQ